MRKKAWKVAPLCMFWALWQERNKRAFDNFESTDQTIFQSKKKKKIKQLKILFCIYFGIELDCTLRVDLYHY